MTYTAKQYKKYLKHYDKTHGTKGGMIKQHKDKSLKHTRKGKVYNTGKALELRTGNKKLDAYWNKS